MRWAAMLAALALGGGCLEGWQSAGPWACDEQGACPTGMMCDDGVCCTPGGAPACPTLPVDGLCPSGAAPTLLYRDADGDGFGDPETWGRFCATPVKEKWVADGSDCDDADRSINPGAAERCNGRDDDCDGVVDDGLAQTTWYRDEDGDGYGASGGQTMQACGQPPGYAQRGDDCDDANAGINPGALERCNGVDDNCNGLVDDPPFADVESPGFDGGVRVDCATGRPGLCAAGGVQCLNTLFADGGSGFVPTCVPRHTPQPDVCGDGLDNDCSGAIDDAPGCGGPGSFIEAPGTRVRTLAWDGGVYPTASTLPAKCMANLQGRSMSWLNPAWMGTTGARHVWSIEAPSGFTWDLSQPSAAVTVAFDASRFIGGENGPWSPQYFKGPVITFCGERDTDYVRLIPDGTIALSGAPKNFAVTVPVAGSRPHWSEESGGALDRTQVKRIEVVVSPVPAKSPWSGDADIITFTIAWKPDAGVNP